METSNLKNMVILKSVPSNIIDEAIVILKKNIKIKEFEMQNSTDIESGKKPNSKKETQNKDYIVKEAEMIINNYCTKVENSNKKEQLAKKLEGKNRKIKKWLCVSIIIAIFEFIILLIK